jgi:hypothetical protein
MATWDLEHQLFLPWASFKLQENKNKIKNTAGTIIRPKIIKN